MKKRSTKGSHIDNYPSSQITNYPSLPTKVISCLISLSLLSVIVIIICYACSTDFKITYDNLLKIAEISFTIIVSVSALIFSIISVKPDLRHVKSFQLNIDKYIMNIFLLLALTILAFTIAILQPQIGKFLPLYAYLVIIVMAESVLRSLIFMISTFKIDNGQ